MREPHTLASRDNNSNLLLVTVDTLDDWLLLICIYLCTYINTTLEYIVSIDYTRYI